MHYNSLAIPEVLVFEPQVYEDERGFFFESFHHQTFSQAVGHTYAFVQDNHSRSVKGVLRGLHYQLPPKAQGKLVRVVVGSVFDVAVDIRRSSPSYGKWVGVELSAQNKKQLWIPPGFAHGFLTLSDQAEVVYKTTEYYAPETDRSLRWDDPSIAIQWPLTPSLVPLVSEKDKKAGLFYEIKPFP